MHLSTRRNSIQPTIFFQNSPGFTIIRHLPLQALLHSHVRLLKRAVNSELGVHSHSLLQLRLERTCGIVHRLFILLQTRGIITSPACHSFFVSHSPNEHGLRIFKAGRKFDLIQIQMLRNQDHSQKCWVAVKGTKNLRSGTINGVARVGGEGRGRGKVPPDTQIFSGTVQGGLPVFYSICLS